MPNDTDTATEDAPILAPSIDDIETLGLEALSLIPDALRRRIDDVIIQVQEFPDEETEAEMGLESPFDLLGLYRGHTLANRTGSQSAPSVDMIFLYRRPILDYWCETGEDLAHVVRHVLIHEIGHHFGLSDEDMDRIEAMADDDEVETD
ncbi:MAG TPA: metallopeptidase family protein [Stellaceae bacterium]|jgi:predicted Zn-dependent protease with MMP-like domain|nr:metallopeptidase family protein [Stellaceae bacterium]